MKKKILLIYHYFHPDEVISARMFSDLSRALCEAGHDVTAYCSNRRHRDRGVIGAANEDWDGVKIRRFPLPPSPGDSYFRRLADSWTIQKQIYGALKRERFDAVIIGSTPYFSYLLFPLLRKLSPGTKLFHWCFDLFPDGIFVEKGFKNKLAYLMTPFTGYALRRAQSR